MTVTVVLKGRFLASPCKTPRESRDQSQFSSFLFSGGGGGGGISVLCTSFCLSGERFPPCSLQTSPSFETSRMGMGASPSPAAPASFLLVSSRAAPGGSSSLCSFPACLPWACGQMVYLFALRLCFTEVRIRGPGTRGKQLTCSLLRASPTPPTIDAPLRGDTRGQVTPPQDK